MQRRQFLKASAATVAALSAPSVLRAANSALKVGTYGGYFQESFDKYIYPDFTAATGIEVESIAEPTGEAWLVQLSQAARAGQAPADVSMMVQLARIKGERSGLWAPLDEAALSNLGNLPDHFVHRYEDGKVYGTGAVSWYITLVTNTDTFAEAPTSWTALWDAANADKLGLMSMATNSFLLEITATTYFGGTDILKTDEGVLQVMDKLAEVKPNVRLWYRDEGQFQLSRPHAPPNGLCVGPRSPQKRRTSDQRKAEKRSCVRRQTKLRLCCVFVEINLVGLSNDFTVVVMAASAADVVGAFQLATVRAFCRVASDQGVVSAAHVPLGAGDFILRDSHVSTSVL